MPRVQKLCIEGVHTGFGRITTFWLDLHTLPKNDPLHRCIQDVKTTKGINACNSPLREIMRYLPGPAANIEVIEASKLLQQFATDLHPYLPNMMDTDDEERMRIQIVVNELRKVKGLIDEYASKYCKSGEGEGDKEDKEKGEKRVGGLLGVRSISKVKVDHHA
jgi:hypothetical protein